MPTLLGGTTRATPSGSLSPLRYQFITLSQAQAALGATPSQTTGYTLVVGANGVATFTNSLGNIGFTSGTITSQTTDGNLVLNPSGTGTITLNGPVNIPQGIIGNGFKKEAIAATTCSIVINTSTSTVVYDGVSITYLDRIVVRAQDNPAENGIYVVQTATLIPASTASSAVTLIRSSDANTTVQLSHAAIPVIRGTTYGRTLFFTTFRSTDTVGVDPIYWREIIDDVSTQTVYNKDIENSSIGITQPGPAQFTTLTATNFNVNSFTVTGSLSVLGAVTMDPVNANVNISPTGTGTVVISAGNAGTMDNIVIGSNTPRPATFTTLQVTTQEYITSSIDSTSTTTGALVVTGGVGIGKNLTVGGNLSLSGAGGQATGNIAAGNISATNLTVSGQSIFTSSTNSTSTTSGSLIIAGGVGIAQDLVLGGQLIFSGQGNALDVQSLKVTTSTNSTSTTTGGVIVTGGVGIGQDVWIGGQLHFTGNGGDLSLSTLTVNSTTNSTSTTTGAITVKGGVGVGGNLVVGGQLIFQGTGSNLSVQTLQVTSSTNSTSSTTGAITVVGGVGIQKDVFIGGNLNLGGSLQFGTSFTATFVSLHVTSTASDTSNFYNNAVYIEGGLSTKKDLSVYGNTVISGNLTVLGTQTTVDSQNTYVIDPVIDVGTGINNTPLTTNDGLDRGLLLHYNTGASSATDNHAFLGRDASTGYLTYKTNIYPGGYENFAPSFASTGSFGTAQFGGLHLLGGIGAISTNTGDLQVLGGIGVAGNSYLSGRITLSNTGANSTVTLNHALMVTAGGIGVAGDSYFGGIVGFGNATASSDPTTGAVKITGGLGVVGNSSLGGPVHIYASTSATSTGTGALIVGGGGGFNGDLYCHKLFTDAGQTQLTNFNGGTISDPLIIANSTTATSTASGALVVYGGVAIGQNLIVGGQLSAQVLYSNGAQVLTTATPTGFDGGVIHYPLVIGDPNNLLNTTALTLNSTVESYNTQSGALISYGGFGVAKSIHLGGTLSREGDLKTYNWAGQGVSLNLPSALYYDISGLGTYTSAYSTFIDTPTFDSAYTTVYNTAATVYIGGAPVANSSNVVFGSAYSLYVNSGTVYIGTTATSTSSQSASAVQLVGGLAVGQDLQVGNNIVAGQIYDTNNRVITSIDIITGTGISGGGTAFGPNAILTITNTGVLSNIAGAGISLNTATGNVTIVNTGVLRATGGTGININTATGNITISNVGVTSVTAGSGISLSTSTGSVAIASIDTLQLVTARGAVTDRPITLTSTGTALNVYSTATIGGSLSVGSSATVGTLFAGTSTLGSLTVNGTALISGNLVVQGSQTIVNSTQTALTDPVIDIGTNVNNTPLTGDDGYDKGLLIHYNTGASTAADNHAFLGMEHASRKLTFRTNIYPGGFETVPNPYNTTGTVGGAIFSDLHLIGGVASTGPTTGDLQVAGGIGISGNSTFAGQVVFNNTTNTISSQTGAVQLAGGLGVGKDVYIAGNLILDGYLLSTASNFNGGTIYKDLISNSLTPSTSTQTGAILVNGTGGIGVGGNVNVGGYINASAIYQNGQPLSTNISLALGPGLSGGVTTTASGVTIALTNTGLTNLGSGTGISLSTSSGSIITITNIGVTGITVGPGLGAIGSLGGVTTSTGTVRLLNLGVTSAVSGKGINIDQSTGTITISNIGVTDITAVGSGLTLSTSTGSLFIANAGVTALTAGTDTYVSAATGAVTVWSYATLQSVTDHGNTTTNAVIINNTTTSTNIYNGALVVGGGAGIGQNLFVGGNSTVIGTLTAPYATIADYSFTGSSIVALANDAALLQVPGNAGSITLQATSVNLSAQTSATINTPNTTITGLANFTNLTSSTNTLTGAVKILGGVAIGNNLYVQGTISATGGYLGLNPNKIFQSTSSVTVIDSGTAPQEVFVSVAGTTSTVFYNNGVSINVPLNAGNIITTGTIQRIGTVLSNGWGSNGIALSILDATYDDLTSQGVVGTAHVNVFGQPTISATSGVATYNDVATVYIKNSPIAGNGNTTITRPWGLYVNNGNVYVGSNTVSTTPSTGALQVAGGVGVGGSLNVGGNVYVSGNTINVGNSEIYTYTSPTVSAQAQLSLDSFGVANYHSAKYLVQVVDVTAAGQPNKVYVSEIMLFHDGLSSAYISEYGIASNTGDLGTFDAALSGGTVTLTFTPNYTPTALTVRVNRTTIA